MHQDEKVDDKNKQSLQKNSLENTREARIEKVLSRKNKNIDFIVDAIERKQIFEKKEERE